MTTTVHSSEDVHVATKLQRQLDNAGILCCSANAAGVLDPAQSNNDSWLLTMLTSAGLVRDAVARLVQTWSVTSEPVLTELIPGVWIVPVPRSERRKLLGYTLLLIPTAGFENSEHFQALCNSAFMDTQASQTRFRNFGAVPDAEVERLALLGEALCRNHLNLAAMRVTTDSVSQQLSESYEELSLLYAMSQNMTVSQRPQRFLQLACEGLLETLPYSWIGIQLRDADESLPSLAGRLFAAGRLDIDGAELETLTRRLLDVAMPDAPSIIDPTTSPAHATFAALGRPILLYPVNRDGMTIGVLIAADREGPDRTASSADIKLLGATASQTGMFLENAALYEDMDAMFLGTLEAITASIDAKDKYTCGHSQRVAQLSQQLATAIGLDEKTIRQIQIAGLVHDVGKIGVPESVLCKPGRLTEAEFDLIKQHPEIGHRILRDIPQLRYVLPGVLYHHERWDGRGYPHGIAGADIPLAARILALADSFDAMSSTRTYRSARDRTWVLEEITRSSGTQFDPELAPVFVGLDFTEFDQLVVEHRADQASAHGEAA